MDEAKKKGAPRKEAWGPERWRRLALRLDTLRPDSYEPTRKVTATDVVRRNRHRMMAVIMSGRGDIHTIHGTLRDEGFNVTLQHLRKLLNGGPVAEPKIPGKAGPKRYSQPQFDAKVREVCAHLERADVPDRIWNRWSELQKLDAAVAVRRRPELPGRIPAVVRA